MQQLQKALDALAFGEARYHDLLNPAEDMAALVKDVAKATALQVKALEARVASLEHQLAQVSHAPAIESDVLPFSPVAPAPDAAPSSSEPEPIVPIEIPLHESLLEKQREIDAPPVSAG